MDRQNRRDMTPPNDQGGDPSKPAQRVSTVGWNVIASLRSDLRKARHRPISAISSTFNGLYDDGLVVLNDYVTPAVCHRLREEIMSIVDDYPEGGQTPNGANVRIRGARRGNPHDEGMVDIFRVDQEVPEARLVARDDTIRSELSKVAGQEIVPRRVNAYVNKGITETRGFHVDSFSSITYKGMLYLTDVLESDDGPFAYVRGSHRFTLRKYRNLLRNAVRRDGPITNMHHIDEHRTEIGLAPQGTLFLGDQNGMHRGFPQAPHRERVVLMTLYTPEDVPIE